MPYKDPKKNHECKMDYIRRNKEYYRAKNNEQRQKIRQHILEYKQRNSCIVCFENDPVCLQFHHRDPSKKEISIANVVSRGWSIKRLEKELEKCDLMCANCHFKYHASKS